MKTNTTQLAAARRAIEAIAMREGSAWKKSAEKLVLRSSWHSQRMPALSLRFRAPD